MRVIKVRHSSPELQGSDLDSLHMRTKVPWCFHPSHPLQPLAGHQAGRIAPPMALGRLTSVAVVESQQQLLVAMGNRCSHLLSFWTLK